jgi:hypothetical protein
MTHQSRAWDARAEYWREAMEYAFEGVGLWDAIKDIPAEKRMEIGESLATSAECQSQAFYTPESPLINENRSLARKLAWERDLIGCGECGGRGRLEYSAGPWWVNTGCHVCDGAGKVHPRGEREPS